MVVSLSKPNAKAPAAAVSSEIRVKPVSNKRGSLVASPFTKNVKVAPSMAFPVTESMTLPVTSTSIVVLTGGGITTSGTLVDTLLLPKHPPKARDAANATAS